MTERDDYRKRRLTFLGGLVDLKRAEGLEIAAFDFPTVLPRTGKCQFADYLSAEELKTKALPAKPDIVPLDYVVKPMRPIHEQIRKRFDYVLLFHVLQKVPDPIGYLEEIGQLLKPDGVIMLAVPDKRRTPDGKRPSTTTASLLERHFRRAKLPSLEDVIDGATAWLDEKRIQAEEAPREFFEWAIQYHASGRADVHCNVWEDREFFEQFSYLTEGGLAGLLRLVAKQDNTSDTAEFFAGFRLGDTKDDGRQPLPALRPKGSEIVDFPFFQRAVRNLEHPLILEIGSREVTGESLRRLLDLPDGSYDYVGLDIHEGPNVDLIGDAHKLSELFLAESIDVVMSKSVFEHLAMPWKVVLEINSILKTGGLMYIQTLFAFPMHELPWDFWRYTAEAWRVLFNDSTGFEIIGTEMNVPCQIVPEDPHPNWKPEDWSAFVNSNVMVRKIGGYDRGRLKWDIAAGDVLENMYPL